MNKKKNEIYFSKKESMETMNSGFTDNMNYNLHNVHLFSSDHSSALPDGEEDVDNEADDDDARTPDSDEDPVMDQKVVHSPLPTDNGGKPKS